LESRFLGTVAVPMAVDRERQVSANRHRLFVVSVLHKYKIYCQI
jgi:hypothetical protein